MMLLVVGCGTPAENATKANPHKELTLEEKAVGTYETNLFEDTIRIRIVLLENGFAEAYTNGKKEEEEAKWKIVNREIHVIGDKADPILVSRINNDGSIAVIADILNGKRKDIPKEEQWTFKKIK